MDEPVRGFVPDVGWLSLPGIERLRALLDGRIPRAPIQHLTGVRLTQVGHGSCTVAMPASPWFQTQMGFFPFGVTALVADFALGGAIGSALPPWTFPVTSEINLTYLRPLRLDAGKLIGRGRLIEAGRSQATSEALIEDGEGRLLAHSTTRCFIRTLEPREIPFQPQESTDYDSPDPFERPIPEDLALPSELADLSGLDVMRMISTGELPAPIMLLTGSSLPDFQPGRVWMSYPATPWFQSSAGTIYGGILCFVSDAISIAAATTMLEAQTGIASLDLNVHFLRPAEADGGRLGGEAEIVHGGKGLILARSEVRNSQGKPLVFGTASFMRRRIRDWVPIRVPRNEPRAAQSD
jgi:uncharacterized protein (TIGR00369 family)